MIRAYVGNLGSGKSYNMIADAVLRYRKVLPQVYTTLRSLHCPGAVWFPVDRLAEISKMSNALLLVDEAQLGAASRFFADAERSLLGSFAQLRKNGIDLYCTTQRLERVDSVLRELVNEEGRCKKVGPMTMVRYLDPHEKNVKQNSGLTLRRMDPRIWASYDSWEILVSFGGGATRAGWLDRIREQVMPKLQERPDPLKLWPGLPVFERRGNVTARTDYGEHLANLHRRSFGVSPVAEDLIFEASRRAWLAWWGLDPDLVPWTVSYANPWAAGGAPPDSEAEARSASVVALAEPGGGGSASPQKKRNRWGKK